MATYTSALNLKKPAGGENVLIGDINGNMDAIDAEAIRSRANFAGTYDASSSYSVGNYCIYGGNLFRCITAIGSGGETWTAGHWTQVAVGEELSTLNGKIATSDTISTGITGLPAAWKVAGIAFIKVYDLKPSANGAIGTLPTGLRPKQACNFAVTQLAGNVVAMLGISTSGEVTASGFDTSKYYYGMMVYPVA